MPQLPLMLKGPRAPALKCGLVTLIIATRIGLVSRPAPTEEADKATVWGDLDYAEEHGEIHGHVSGSYK